MQVDMFACLFVCLFFIVNVKAEMTPNDEKNKKNADAASMPLATGRGGFMGLGLGLGLGLGFGDGFSGIYSGNGDHQLAMQALFRTSVKRDPL